MNAFDKDVLMMSMRHKFIYSMTGLLLGLVSMIGGVGLFLNGVVGSSNLTAKLLGTEGTITDAAPGAILFIIGLFVIIATRYKVNVAQYTPEGESEVIRFSRSR